jgi:hypothetical protein
MNRKVLGVGIMAVAVAISLWSVDFGVANCDNLCRERKDFYHQVPTANPCVHYDTLDCLLCTPGGKGCWISKNDQNTGNQCKSDPSVKVKWKFCGETECRLCDKTSNKDQEAICIDYTKDWDPTTLNWYTCTPTGSGGDN